MAQLTSVDFIYGFNQFVGTTIAQNVVDPNTTPANSLSGKGQVLSFWPGKFAGEGAVDSFIVYRTKPLRDIEFFMINGDTLDYQIYSLSYDNLHRILDAILSNFNVNIIFQQNNIVPGFRLMLAHARVLDESEDIYIEGNNYWMATLQFRLIYSYIATPVSIQQASFISA